MTELQPNIDLVAATPAKQLEAQACWQVVGQIYNRSDSEIPYTFTYTVGLQKLDSTSTNRSASVSHEISIGLDKQLRLLQVSATYRFTNSTQITEAHVSESKLTQAEERKLELKVSPGKSLFLWQLVAVYGSASVWFPAYYVSNDPLSPAEVVRCTVTVLESRRIAGLTRVRLRHEQTGKYLIAIKRKGWEAATLGNSKEVHFHIVPHADRRHVRICIAEPMFDGYNCLFSSDRGGIYFDHFSEEDKQLWVMSIANPVDGDAVTFRSRKWPNSGLVLHEGPDTNVYCWKSHNLDKWILEVV